MIYFAIIPETHDALMLFQRTVQVATPLLFHMHSG